MKRLYPDGFIWQQDGSGVHRAQIVNNFISQNMPQNLDLPSYSPDVSPLENVWKLEKGEVAKDCPKTLRSLKNSIKKHWNRIDVDFLTPFINSMPNRINMLIQNKGGRIDY